VVTGKGGILTGRRKAREEARVKGPRKNPDGGLVHSGCYSPKKDFGKIRRKICRPREGGDRIKLRGNFEGTFCKRVGTESTDNPW